MEILRDQKIIVFDALDNGFRMVEGIEKVKDGDAPNAYLYGKIQLKQKCKPLAV